MNQYLLFPKKIFLNAFVILLISLPIFGWSFSGTPSPPSGLEVGLNTDVSLDGRTFDVYVPAGFSGSLPLIVDHHGYSRSNSHQRGYSGFYQLADIEGFIVAWPQGRRNAWNAAVCCGTAPITNYDDTGFILNMVDWIVGQNIAGNTTVDTNRVYATGHSNGGALSHRLALESADVFAAIAPVAFHLVYSNSTLGSLVPSRPMPVLEIHGNSDGTIRYPCSMLYGCVEDGFESWAAINACTGAPVETWNNGNGAFRRAYQNCDSGVAVEWLVVNAPHNAYANSDGIDVAATAWEFLSRYTLN